MVQFFVVVTVVLFVSHAEGNLEMETEKSEQTVFAQISLSQY